MKIIAFIFVVACSSIAEAQNHKLFHQHYMGLYASFGRRSFDMKSNYPQIDKSTVSLDGGQAGVIFGNRIARAEIGLLEYYSSVSNIVGTIDQHSNHAAIRFYPAGLLTKKRLRVEPYLNAGITYNRYKFYGHYISSTGSPVNYSAPDPFLGGIAQTNTSMGLGFEFNILDEYDFVHLFTELKWGKPAAKQTGSPEFTDMHLGRKTTINIGFTFGLNR